MTPLAEAAKRHGMRILWNQGSNGLRVGSRILTALRGPTDNRINV
jgi:hypothetical protein